MNTTAENITFMVVRGIVALAIVGVGFYCIAQGIHFFALPRVEAEQISIHFIGLDITAQGLGAVIFGVGLGICYVGRRTAPTRIETTRTTDLTGSGRPNIEHRLLEIETSRHSESRAADKVSEPSSRYSPAIQPIGSGSEPSGSVRITEGVVVTESASGTEVQRFD